MRTAFKVLFAAVVLAAPAAALVPYIQGGLGDVGHGDWLWTAPPQEPEYFVTRFGSTWELGGGLSWDIAQFRQPSITPTLSLDTEANFYRKRGEWPYGDLEGWQQTFNVFSVTETLVLRLRIPVLSRLVTPYVGAGGGVSVAPSSISRMEGFPNPSHGGYYEDSVVGIVPTYTVPFGVEITLTPQNTIYARFGPLAPSGKVTYEYLTSAGDTVTVESEIPNAFLVLVGYRFGI